MPSMADLVVKKADGTTNVTFNALTPSSGDTVPAVWRQEAMATQPNLKATASLRTGWNGPRDARRAQLDFSYPFVATDTTTGLTSVVARIPIQVTATIPQLVTDAIISEAVAQAGNIFAAALVQSAVKAGYAPT